MASLPPSHEVHKGLNRRLYLYHQPCELLLLVISHHTNEVSVLSSRAN